MTPAEVPAAYVQRVAQVESGNNPHAVARTSTASGLFQFTLSTWEGLRREYPELRLSRGGRLDPAESERAFRQFTANNARGFRRQLGRDPSLSELYLCHFLGCAGAVQACSINGSLRVADVFGPAVARANPFLAGWTCAELRAWARRKVPDVMPVPSVLVAGSAPPPRPVAGRGPGGVALEERRRSLTAADLNAASLRRAQGEAEGEG